MTVWIEKPNQEFADDWLFAAYHGFKYLGSIIQTYSKPEKIHYKKGDIVVGGIGNIRYIANKLNITLPNFYIPKELTSYAGRNITKSTVGEVITRIHQKEKLFIKPILTKGFPAQVVNELPLITYPEQEIKDFTECWVSKIVNFVSEYRLFLHKRELIGCKHYWGDFRISLDWKIVDKALSELLEQPAGWTLDFGVTDKGETLLIEANDGYSIGNYGLDGVDYAKLLRDRFLEITK